MVREKRQVVPRTWAATEGGWRGTDGEDRTHSIRIFAKIKLLIDEEFGVQSQAHRMAFEGGATLIMYR